MRRFIMASIIVAITAMGVFLALYERPDALHTLPLKYYEDICVGMSQSDLDALIEEASRSGLSVVRRDNGVTIHCPKAYAFYENVYLIVLLADGRVTRVAVTNCDGVLLKQKD
jgi:flagellar biosynthesis/type III secretory pathway M-ring protein FliF/YscJ